MSIRSYINGKEIFADTPLFYKELENQGLVVDEDYCWGKFEIKEFMPCLLAFDKDVKESVRKSYDKFTLLKSFAAKAKCRKGRKAQENRLREQDPKFFDFRYDFSTPMINEFMNENFVDDPLWTELCTSDLKWAELEPYKTAEPSTLTVGLRILNSIEFATVLFFKAVEDDIERNDKGIWSIKKGHKIISERF